MMQSIPRFTKKDVENELLHIQLVFFSFISFFFNKKK